MTRTQALQLVKSFLFETNEGTAISLIENTDTGGSLLSDKANVRVSVLTEYGETIPCPRISIDVSAGSSLDVVISRSGKAKGYRIYASYGDDIETFQTSVYPFQKSTETVNLTVIGTGSAMPESDTGTEQLLIENYETHLDSALRIYNSNYYNRVSAEIETDGTTYQLDLPENWSSSSTILDVQYPNDFYPPVFLNPDRQVFVKDGKFNLINVGLQAGKSLTVYYGIPYTLTDDDENPSTLPEDHANGICTIAAAFAFLQLSVKYGQTGNRQIGADTVDYMNKSREFRLLSEEWLKSGYRQIGVPEDGKMSTSATVSYEIYDSHSEVVF